MSYYNISISNLINWNIIGDPQLPGHKTTGISLKTFCTSLGLSSLIFVIQILNFSYLRTKIKKIYQPRCFYVFDKYSVENISETFFGWIKPSILFPISDYITISGLDAYFFLRFVRLLFYLSISLTFLNIPILLPINFFGNDDSIHVSGLDKLSWSNIGPKNNHLLFFHLVTACITIASVHVVIFHELKQFIKIRQNFLLKNKDVHSVVMIDNMPANYKTFHDSVNSNPLFKAMNMLPGKISNLWFIYEFTTVKKLFERNKVLLKKLEEKETKIVIEGWKFFRKQELLDKQLISNNSKLESVSDSLNTDNNIERNKYNVLHKWWKIDKKNVNVNSNKKNTKEISFLTEYTSKIMNDLTKTFSQNLTDLAEQYIENNKKLIQERDKVLKDKVPQYNKVFVKFNSRISSYLLKQVLISADPCKMNFKVIEIDPKDIIWNNVNLNNLWMKKIRFFMANSLTILLVAFWAIPTALIGSMSQSYNFSKLFPFLSWIENFPSIIKNFFFGIFPVLSLLLITEIIPICLRYLSILKGNITGAEVETNIQSWCFLFFFIHIFLIVTVSSSIIAIFDSFINNPVSIPALLALNIPKSANFFFSFILIRGLTYSGNNLLQGYTLVKKVIWFNIFGIKTPSSTFRNVTKLDRIQWGSVYPMYSVLGCISIIFSIIAPLILLFSALSFFLILVSFKYSLRFSYHYYNPSETFGKFYPVALKQLFYGVYCLEICLIGLFFLCRSEDNEPNAMNECGIMLVMFLVSVLIHIYTDNCYTSSSKYLPLEFLDFEEIQSSPNSNNEPDGQVTRNGEDVINCFNSNNYDITFSHPSFQYDAIRDIVWIPKDKYGVGDKEINYLKSKGIQSSNSNAIINDSGEILINGGPPYTEQN